MTIRILGLLLITLTLASCGGPTGTDERKAVTLADSSNLAVGLCDSFDLVQFAMDTNRAAQIADSFLDFYRHDDEGGKFTDEAASFPIPTNVMLAFEGLAPDLDPSTQCLGVRIAYGLDENARPLFLFAPVVMTRTTSEVGMLSFRLEEPAAWYIPTNRDWQPLSSQEVEAAMQRYASRVLKYVDGALTPLHIDPRLGSASDPSSTLFPFTEFRELIRENEAMVRSVYKDKAEIPSITAVRVRWAAEKIGDDGTLKQVVVLVPVLDGSPYPGADLPLTLKAANFNTVCPPSCAASIVSYRAIAR